MRPRGWSPQVKRLLAASGIAATTTTTAAIAQPPPARPAPVRPAPDSERSPEWIAEFMRAWNARPGDQVELSLPAPPAGGLGGGAPHTGPSNTEIPNYSGAPASRGSARNHTGHDGPPLAAPYRDVPKSETGLWYSLTPEDRTTTDDHVLGRVVDVDPARTLQRRQQLARELEDAVAALPGPAPEIRDAADAVRVLARARRAKPGWWRPLQDQLRDVAPRAERDGVRIVATGLDTLVLSWQVELRPEIFQRLATLRAMAEAAAEGDEDAGGPVWLARNELRWEVQPRGAKPHWRYLLIGPACTLKIRRGTPKNGIPVEVEFRSAWLWRDGYDVAVETIREMLRSWSVDPAIRPRALVTRIDLAVDWQGWAPTGRELLDGEIVTRAQRRGFRTRADRLRGKKKQAEGGEGEGTDQQGLGAPLWFGENDAEHRVDSAWWRGRTFTGYEFGKGAQSACIYLKTLEIKTSGKLWFHGIWGQSPGYDPGQPVWRAEFRLRGSALRGLLSTLDKPVGGDVGRDDLPANLVRIGAQWDHVRSVLDGLWARLTGRDGTGGWLNFRVRMEGGNVSRWPVRPAWRALAEAAWPDAGRARVRRLPKTVRTTERHILALQDGRKATNDQRQIGLDHWMHDADRERFWRGSRVDLDAVARAIGGPRTLELFGDGARHQSDAHPAVELENARDRADALRRQVIGVAARYVAELDIAAGRAPPTDAREAWARMVEDIKRDAHLEIRKLDRHVAHARDRAAITSAARFDQQRCQGRYTKPAAATATA